MTWKCHGWHLNNSSSKYSVTCAKGIKLHQLTTVFVSSFFHLVREISEFLPEKSGIVIEIGCVICVGILMCNGENNNVNTVNKDTYS